MTATNQKVKIVKAEEPANSSLKPEKKAKLKLGKEIKNRSKKYVLKKSLVNRNKKYDVFAAVELVKKLSYTKFDGTIVAHGLVKEVGDQFGVIFPYSTGKSLRVAVVNLELIKDLEANRINFDILICAPQDMPKIMKYARVLGPKGLMPNPKNGTVANDVEKKKKELEAGKLMIKTEKKAPLIHVVVGKVSFNTKDLVENLKALIKATQNKLVKLSIVATMSSAVKVDFEKSTL